MYAAWTKTHHDLGSCHCQLVARRELLPRAPLLVLRARCCRLLACTVAAV